MARNSPVLNVTITSEDKSAQGVSSATASFEGFGSKVSGIMVGIGAAVGTMAADFAMQVGGMVKDAFIQIDEADSALRSQLGLSSEEAGRFAEVGAKVYEQAWGESLAEVSLAAANVADTLNVTNDAELEKVTSEALALADVFGVDVDGAIRTAGQLLKQGLVDDGQEAIDLLTVGLQQMPADIRDELFEATNEYGKFFADLGLNGQETYALLTNAADEYGIYGIDKTGDALKEFTIRATDMSTGSVEAYEKIGLSAGEMSNAILAGGDSASDAFTTIVEGLLDIEDPAERANAAIALFGTPIEDLGVTGIPTFLESLIEVPEAFEDVDGAGEQMAKDATTWQDQIESLKRRGLGALVRFITNDVVPNVKRLVSAFKEAWPQIKAAAMPVIEWVKSNVAPVVQEFVALWQEWLEKVKVYIETWVAVIQEIWDRYGANILEQLETTWELVKTVIEGALQVIKGIIETFTAVLRGDWRKAWEGIKNILEGIWRIIGGVVRYGVDTIRNIMSAAWQTIKSAVSSGWDKIKSTLSTAWERLKSVVSLGASAIVGSVTGIPGRISSTVSSMWDGIKTGITSARDWVRDRINSIVGYITGIPGRVLGIGQSMFNAGQAIFRRLVDGIKSIWNSTIGGRGISFGGGGIGPLKLPKVSFTIPRLHTGGVVPGRSGEEVLALLQAGEHVTPIGGVPPQGTTTNVHVNMPAGSRPTDVVQAIRKYQRRNGLAVV